MRIWIRSLVFKEIIIGASINWCKELRVYRTIDDAIMALKTSGHSLLIGSIFGRVKFVDDTGTRGFYPEINNGWRDFSISVLRALLKSGIEFEIIGDKEELGWIQENNSPIYDEVMKHILWKGKKHGSNRN